MKKAKVVSAIMLPVLLIVGLIAASVYAKRPEPQPIEVSITGAIEGNGDPAAIRLTFKESSFGGYAGTYVANPDGILRVARSAGPGKRGRILEYFYCDHSDHTAAESICNVTSHDPSSYKCLYIYGGVLEGRKETERIVFPVDSSWRITKKIVDPITGNWSGEVVAEDTLKTKVTYLVLGN